MVSCAILSRKIAFEILDHLPYSFKITFLFPDAIYKTPPDAIYKTS